MAPTMAPKITRALVRRFDRQVEVLRCRGKKSDSVVVEPSELDQTVGEAVVPVEQGEVLPWHVVVDAAGLAVGALRRPGHVERVGQPRPLLLPREVREGEAQWQHREKVASGRRVIEGACEGLAVRCQPDGHRRLRCLRARLLCHPAWYSASVT